MESSDDNKSRHGSDFKDELLSELIRLKQAGLISNVQTNKKFSYGVGMLPQFLAPYFLEVKSKKIAIFTTTSIRSDRLKITQWDSWGIKNVFNGEAKCILVVPNNLSDKENRQYTIEAKKNSSGKYLTAIDNILKLSDLNNYLQ